MPCFILEVIKRLDVGYEDATPHSYLVNGFLIPDTALASTIPAFLVEGK